MRGARVVLAIALADFRERVRRHSYLVTLTAAGWLGWLVVSGQVFLSVGGYCGVMNGAWAGALVAGTTSLMVSLVGFWVVKNCVERDRATRVGEILAASPLTKAQYALGKFLSNAALLATIVVVLMIVAPILVVVRGVGGPVDLPAMISPFLLIALPCITMTAALAVLFETLRPLSGGIGNVLWLFLWSALLVAPMASGARALDLSGIAVMQDSLGAAAAAAYPDSYRGGFTLSIGGSGNEPTKGTFVWHGVEWTPARVAQRCVWIVAAALIALIAALPFDRFDESRRQRRKDRLLESREMVPESKAAIVPGTAHLTAIPAGRRASLFPVYLGELRLMLKGRGLFWWVVAGGLFVAEVATPSEIGRGKILPVAWIWPVLIWSQMGARETKEGTEALVFSAPRPLAAQLPALYLAGLTVAVAAGGGTALECLATGSLPAFWGWLAGAFFVPALALCLGTWSGTAKVFEAIYTALWYVGPMQPIASLDFMGASDAAIASGMPLRTAVAAVVLLALAIFGRRRRITR